MSYEPEKDDPDFVEDLKKSETPVLFAAQLLRHKGVEVSLSPFEVRPDVSERYEYQDEADLFARRPIEVKKRDLDFSCEDDYPYPSIYIDEKYKLNEEAWFYMILNESLTHFILAETRLSKRWGESAKRHKGTELTFVTAPYSCVSFHTVPDDLR